MLHIFFIFAAIESEKKKESQEDSVETYEEAFVRIKEMTGEDDIDKLVRRFIEVEDTNFALFNYVNEQNNEIEKLNDDINNVSYNAQYYKPSINPYLILASNILLHGTTLQFKIYWKERSYV